MKYSSFYEILRERVKESPDKTAYIYLKNSKLDEQRTTYADLDKNARIIAAKLQSVTKKGDRVLLLYPPGIDFIYGYLACFYAGVVAVPTYPPDPTRFRKTLPRLRSIINSAEAKVVLTVKIISNISPVMFALSPDLMKLKWINTDRLSEKLTDDWQEPEIDSDDVAFLQYTSGSTADPKGVMVTHKNLIYNSDILHNISVHNEESVFVCWVPNYHDMGLIGGILQPLYGNLLGVIFSPLTFLKSPITWIKAISKYKGTTTPFPNFALDLCVKKIKDEDLEGIDLSSWTIACNGAEPIKKESLDRFYEKFSKYGYQAKTMRPAYGLAEATLIVSGGPKGNLYESKNLSKTDLAQNKIREVDDNSEDSVNLIGCGKTIVGQTVKIVDPETLIACNSDQIGEVWVSSPCITKGYWKQPDKTKETFEAMISPSQEGPFLRTGDLGFLDNDELYITGRLKDLIIIRGVNYYPQDIEQTVEKTSDSIRLGCVSAYSVEVGNEEKLVVLAEVYENKVSKKSLKGLASEVLAEISDKHSLIAHDIVFIKSKQIFKTSSGKIQRRKCKQFYEDKKLKPLFSFLQKGDKSKLDELVVEKTSVTDNSTKYIRDFMHQYLQTEFEIPKENIDDNKPFTDYGVDSVQAMEILGAVEKEYEIILPETILFEYSTIAELAKYIDSKTNKKPFDIPKKETETKTSFKPENHQSADQKDNNGKAFIMFEILQAIFYTITFGTGFFVSLTTFDLIQDCFSKTVAFFAVPALVYLFLLTIITMVWLLRIVLPSKLETGYHDAPKSKAFFAWTINFVLNRVLFMLDPIKNLILYSLFLRFLAVRALGGKIKLFSSMSANIQITDLPMISIGEGCVIGARSLITGHFINEGKIALGRVEIGNNVNIGAGTSIAPFVKIGDSTNIGAECKIAPMVEIGKNCNIKPLSILVQGTKVLDGQTYPAD